MLAVHIHIGHQSTIDSFIKSMEASGYTLAARYKNLTAPSSTIKFHRPGDADAAPAYIAVAT